MRAKEEIEQYFKDRNGSPLTREEIEWYIDNVPESSIPEKERNQYLDNIQFLSPNEPITEYGV